MASKKGMSLRYKILLMLTMLPLLTLGFYAYQALSVFKTDKLAYVYDSSTIVAKTLSAQASSDFLSLLNSAKPIMQEFIFRGSFGQVSQGILVTDGPIQWVMAMAPDKENPKKLKQLASTEREGTSAATDTARITDFDNLTQAGFARSRTITVPFKDDQVLLIEKVSPPNESPTLFLVMAKMPELAQGFHNPGTSENFLIDEAGNVLFGPSERNSLTMSDFLGDEFLAKIQRQQFSSGAEAVKTMAGEDMLAGYSKAGFGGTTVLSLIPQKEALKAVKVLFVRSLLFVFALICATIIVSLFASGNLTASLSELFRATQSVAEGHFDVRVKVTSADEVGSLATSFNAMAGEVQRLMGETAEKARMQSELKTAQTVQETLFPKDIAKIGNVKIAGFYEPASECGGDWWSYCEVGDKIYFWIGDATGHGAAAALITSAAKSAATIIERLNVEPREAMALMNRSIYEVSHGNIMMTFFLGCYEQSSKKFVYCNASHEGPFLIKKGEAQPKKKDLIPLNEVNNPRLGQAQDTKYEQTELTLELGDRILFYTDGIPDIQNPDLVAWGEREFIKGILKSNADYPDVEVAVKELIELFSSYRQGASLKDDITFFMCEVQGEIS